MLIHFVKTIVLITIYSFLWQRLEKKIYGEVTHRSVDDIIMILLIPVFWMATR